MAIVEADSSLGAELRRHGHRLTRPRELVWATLHSGDRHLTVEQIASQVHAIDPGVNVASVYRSLTLFAELDLARESRLAGQGAARWEPAHPDEHFHLVCRSCGEVEHHVGDLVQQVRAHLEDGHAFRADTVDLVVTGVCNRCRLTGATS